MRQAETIAEKICLISLRRMVTPEEKKKLVSLSFEEFYNKIYNKISKSGKFKIAPVDRVFWKKIYNQFKKDAGGK